MHRVRFILFSSCNTSGIVILPISSGVGICGSPDALLGTGDAIPDPDDVLRTGPSSDDTERAIRRCSGGDVTEVDLTWPPVPALALAPCILFSMQSLQKSAAAIFSEPHLGHVCRSQNTEGVFAGLNKQRLIFVKLTSKATFDKALVPLLLCVCKQMVQAGYNILQRASDRFQESMVMARMLKAFSLRSRLFPLPQELFEAVLSKSVVVYEER
eukprot:m.73352 g.73352  ORF g.73352 m.73352 type:complete len:213 (-) comp12403_c0_seq1:1035-1673(-)